MALSGQAWSDVIRQAGLAYGINPAFLQAINQREQGGRADFTVNDWDSNAARGTPSAGPFQFIEPTFKGYARHAREANPAAWRGVEMSWRNPVAQALAASWAFANGHGKAWSTFQKALGDAGGSMRGKAGSVAGMPSQGLTGPSAGMPDRKAQALSLIFDGDPFWQLLAQSNAGSDPAMPVAQSGATAGGKGVPARRAGEPGWKYLQRIAQSKFGLRNDPGDSQTTGGRHAPGSDHYRGTAIDFGDGRNSLDAIRVWDRFVAANAAALGIKQHIPIGSRPDHMDHSHTSTLRAIRGGK